jgi:2-isopropylmalate synthase
VLCLNQDRDGVKQIAIDGAKMVADRLASFGAGNLRLQYSPESFTGTELDYALDVCESVMEIWQSSSGKPNHHQSASNGRDVDAKHLCRSN